MFWKVGHILGFLTAYADVNILQDWVLIDWWDISTNIWQQNIFIIKLTDINNIICPMVRIEEPIEHVPVNPTMSILPSFTCFFMI